MSNLKAMNNIEALNDALDYALTNDKKVCMWGQDAGYEGGVFRATQGLQMKHGESRVFDAPISEAAIVGVGIGAAIYGMKPIVEIQFSGFSYPIFQQLFTHGARMRNRSRGRFTVPMIVRMPMGGGVRALEHHSEALEALYSHIPGVKVVMPSTPYDVKGMMLAALKENDPVVFFEHKRLYRAFKQEIPTGHYEVEIGKANIIKEGSSVTVVTYGAQVHDMLELIPILAKERPDIDIELIDLRTIKPWDRDTVVASVKKTGRLLVVHEAVKSFSVSAEIIATINEKAFESLIAPPSRVTGYDITVPLAKGEHYHAISVDKIKEGILKVCDFEF